MDAKVLEAPAEKVSAGGEMPGVDGKLQRAALRWDGDHERVIPPFHKVGEHKVMDDAGTNCPKLLGSAGRAGTCLENRRD